MLRRIKGLLLREKGLSREQLAALGGLPPGERSARLADLLHERCVRSAARFVEEEHRRADSPFRAVPQADLFHEMLVMDLWILASLLGGREQALLDRLHRHYAASFVWGEAGGEGLLAALRGKHAAYAGSWDDHTGHQDAFARQAIGIIFGTRRVADEPQAAFWLITHADRTMREFAHLARSVNLLLRGAA